MLLAFMSREFYLSLINAASITFAMKVNNNIPMTKSSTLLVHIEWLGKSTEHIFV